MFLRTKLLLEVESLRRQKSNQIVRNKKLSKKRPPPAALEQSSLYEDLQVGDHFYFCSYFCSYCRRSSLKG